MVGVVQQYEMNAIATLESSLGDWARKANQAMEVQGEFDCFQSLVYSSKASAANLTQRNKSSQTTT